MISLGYLAETHTIPLWEHVHNLGCLKFPQKKHFALKMSLQLNITKRTWNLSIKMTSKLKKKKKDQNHYFRTLDSDWILITTRGVPDREANDLG